VRVVAKALAVSLLLAFFYLESDVQSAPVQPTTGELSEWDRLVAGAKQEGKLHMYGPRGLEKFRQALTDPFEKKYGTAIEYAGLGARELLQLVPKERAAGNYLWDIFVGGTDTLLFNMKALRVLEPVEPALVLPDVKDAKNWQGGRLPFFDGDRLGLFILYGAARSFFVNTAVAPPEEITSYRDLLSPKWKGQILLTRDPRMSGHGRSTFAFFYMHKDLGPEFIRALLRQELRIPKDDHDAEVAVSRGQFGLCICNNAEAAILVKERLPVKGLDAHKIKEGGSVSSSFANVALVNRAPHPNAAKLYLNWLLSRETGHLLSEVTALASPRVDVSTEFVDPLTVPERGWPITNNESSLAKAIEMVEFLKAHMEPYTAR